MAGIAGVVAIDEPGAFGEIARVEEGARRKPHRVGVADMRADVGQCDLGCLDHQMEGGEIVNRVGADPEAPENAERDQRRKALTVRRNFMDLGAERGLRDRADPIGLCAAEIIGMQRPAIRRCVRDHPLGEFAAVEVLAFAGDDAFERVGMARHGDALADRGGFPGRQERLGKARLVASRSAPALHNAATVGVTWKPSRA